MRKLLYLVLGLFFSISAKGSDTLMTYVFTDNAEEYVDLVPYVKIFLDSTRQYTIEDLIAGNHPKFSVSNRTPLNVKRPVIAWSGIKFVNKTSKSINGFIDFIFVLDTAKVYVVQNGEIVDKQLFQRITKPHKKTIPAQHHEMPINLDINESKIYFSNCVYRHSNKPNLMRVGPMTFFSIKSRVHHYIFLYSVQFFYAGIMLLFGLVSLFMFIMFREKIFIYFLFLMFFMVLYFLSQNGLLTIIFNQSKSLTSKTHFLAYPIISGLLLSFFLFISSYIDLKNQMPKYYKLYLFYSIFSGAFGPITNFLTNDPLWLRYVNNILVLIFIILSLMAQVVLAKNGNKSAKIILLSVVCLVIGASMFIFSTAFNFQSGEVFWRWSFQFSTLLFSGILFYGLFQKVTTIRAEKRHFQALDQLKTRFFTNISHEFRTPLTLVMGPVKEAAKTHPDPVAQNQLNIAHRNANRLLQLINQLLDLSKLESGKMQLAVREQNFNALLKGIVMSFESLAVRKNIRLHFGNRNEDLQLWVDADKIEKIFFNLLSNAFKFTKENGEISVLITEEKDAVEVLVRDTGIGIRKKRLPHIFDRFFQADNVHTNVQEGTGIGLALVKELVHLHAGSIDVKSKTQQGTTFIIRFLKGKMHFEETAMAGQSENIQATEDASFFGSNQLLQTFLAEEKNQLTASTPSNPPLTTNQPIVLIIDDNADIRGYIRGHLEKSFQIVEAINGEDGIEKAFEHLPDLIISDVMMPKKNGYEVCETLKTDQRTSHIPFILLTAKAAREEKIQGLETGADDYLIKPFDSEELQVRVQNLIKIREQLRQQFSNSMGTPQPKLVGTNEVDRTFYEKVISIIHDRITDEQFSVEVLASTVGMSRVQLNRKLKALTDNSASKFIQSIRLNKAHELLLQKAGNVSEIAFETGFSSTAYFVKCYREKFGETPGSVL